MVIKLDSNTQIAKLLFTIIKNSSFMIRPFNSIEMNAYFGSNKNNSIVYNDAYLE